MKSFTKTVTTTYDPEWITLDFCKFNKSFQEIRDPSTYNSCFKCDKKFNLEEDVSLAGFKNFGNKVFCRQCAVELKECA